MVSMVGEKVMAAMEASDALLAGGIHAQLVARYQELVAANIRHLTA